LAGLDSGLSPATDRERLGTPIASIHFIDLRDRGTFGVLARPDPAGNVTYSSWQLRNSLDEIATQIRDSIDTNIKRASLEGDPSWLATGGEALTGLLFAGTALTPGAGPETILSSLMQHRSPPEGPPPALYIRAITQSRSALLGLPLGMVSLPVSESERDFVGFHFRIEMPLDGIPYERTASCIRRWVVLTPPANSGDSALKDARDQVDGWLTRLNPPNAGTILFDDLTKFADWSRLQAAPDTEATALLIISHHDKERLWFDASWTLPIAQIRRELRRPTIVILTACGTTEPGTTAVVKQFADAGASAAIATWTEVEGRMAGRFVSLFMDELAANSKVVGYSIGRAFFDSTKKLGAEPVGGSGKRYGAFALLFALMGDAGLQLCLPGVETP
jgi:hypothetical protein